MIVAYEDKKIASAEQDRFKGMRQYTVLYYMTSKGGSLTDVRQSSQSNRPFSQQVFQHAIAGKVNNINDG